MTLRTLTAMFQSRSEAQAAADELLRDPSLGRPIVEVFPSEGVTDEGWDAARPYEERGYYGALRSLSLPDEDRYAYAEGMRRDGVLVTAKVDEEYADRVSDVLERHGAMDLDAQETSWKQQGWSGWDESKAASWRTGAAGTTAASSTASSAATSSTATGSAATGARMAAGAGRTEAIPVVEETLRVGKRVVQSGRVRVRSYVVETPVEEQVTLRQEHVHVERRPVDRPLGVADADAFRERTIEVEATSEEAVVAKEAHVREEVVVGKEAETRTETVRDTVRRTEVEVEGDPSVTGGASVTGGTSTTSASVPGGTGTTTGRRPL